MGGGPLGRDVQMVARWEKGPLKLLLCTACCGVRGALVAVTGADDGSVSVTCDNVLTAPFGHIESENGHYHNLHSKCWLIKPPGRRTVLSPRRTRECLSHPASAHHKLANDRCLRTLPHN